MQCLSMHDFTAKNTLMIMISPGACQKIARDLGLGGGFRRVLWFPPTVTTGLPQLSCKMTEKVTKNKIPTNLMIMISAHNSHVISHCPGSALST